eukprot:5279155-Pleurochrysis_carterae.AAC.4
MSCARMHACFPAQCVWQRNNATVASASAALTRGAVYVVTKAHGIQHRKRELAIRISNAHAQVRHAPECAHGAWTHVPHGAQVECNSPPAPNATGRGWETKK